MNKYIRYGMLILLVITSCKGETMSDPKNSSKDLNEIPASSWENLAGKKIFFGHQSVGVNIMDGINDIMKIHPTIKLKVKDNDQTGNISGGIFAHFPIGKNEDPSSKIQDFTLKMKHGLGDKSDIAFFKFCFVDITADTDVQTLFNSYKNEMSSLKKKYPHVSFIHVTVPLLKKEKIGMKAVLNKVIGKSGGFFDNAHNVKRNQYNDLLRQEYKGKETIFDLAEAESTRTDGTRETFTVKGKKYFSLDPEYTDDGGHLNELGRVKVAEQFLLLLVKL